MSSSDDDSDSAGPEMSSSEGDSRPGTPEKEAVGGGASGSDDGCATPTLILAEASDRGDAPVSASEKGRTTMNRALRLFDLVGESAPSELSLLAELLPQGQQSAAVATAAQWHDEG